MDADTDEPYATPTPADAPPVQIQYFTPPELTQDEFSPRYAGFWLRFCAIVIDGVILVLPISVILTLIELLGNPVPLRRELGLVLELAWPLCLALVGWIYFAAMESSRRQATLGKAMLGLIVTDIDGHRISFGRATARLFSKALSCFPFCIGFLITGFTGQKQAAHDLIANTLVVHKSANWGWALKHRKTSVLKHACRLWASDTRSLT